MVGKELGVAAEHDVGATPGHVGGHGDRTLAAGHRDDRGLACVLLRVQDLMRDTGPLQLPAEQLGLVDRRGADQHGLPVLVAAGDVSSDGRELCRLGAVDQVGLVGADHRLVRGDLQHPQAVDLLELRLLGLGRAGHAGEFVVHAEVVLQRDRGEGLVLVLDLDGFLGLERLVQALVVAAADQRASGVLVDDQHLTLGHHVVLVSVEQFLGADRVVQVADQRGVDGLVQILDAQHVFGGLDAVGQHRHGALLLVHLVVEVTLESAGEVGEDRVPLLVLGCRAGNDQRGSGLVDQDRVDLVDDGVMVAALYQVVGAERHVVAQVVEAEFVVGAVGDVGAVGLAAFRG